MKPAEREVLQGSHCIIPQDRLVTLRHRFWGFTDELIDGHACSRQRSCHHFGDMPRQFDREDIVVLLGAVLQLFGAEPQCSLKLDERRFMVALTRVTHRKAVPRLQQVRVDNHGSVRIADADGEVPQLKVHLRQVRQTVAR